MKSVHFFLSNVQCGRIQCQGGSDRPLIDSNAKILTTKVKLNHSEFTCRGAYFHLGDDVSDPAMVAQGTACAPGKVGIFTVQLHWKHTFILYILYIIFYFSDWLTFSLVNDLYYSGSAIKYIVYDNILCYATLSLGVFRTALSGGVCSRCWGVSGEMQRSWGKMFTPSALLSSIISGFVYHMKLCYFMNVVLK